MPDWLFYAIVVLWTLWFIIEALTVWNLGDMCRDIWLDIRITLWWVFTIFLWSYILLGLGIINLVSSFFE